jgi:hypothetical protein
MTYLERHRIAVARKRGQMMAWARWKLDRERRERLAAIAPERYPGRIMRRIVVIDEERDVRETVIFESDSEREARRKVRKVMEFSGDGMIKKCPNRSQSVPMRTDRTISARQD